MNPTEFTLRPIGHVRVRDGVTTLEVDEAYRPALTGLDGFSHINVLWWCHLTDDDDCRAMVTWDQPYRHGPATLGIFATRAPLRPNPIALSIAPLLAVDVAAGTLRIGFIDAEDGTPILDIKPYLPAVDRLREVSVPDWSAHWPQWYEDSAAFDWSAEIVGEF